MNMKLKMEFSDSTKELSRRSPFVLGLSGQNYNFSSGYSPFIGGPFITSRMTNESVVSE